MSNYFTEAEEFVRRARLAEHRRPTPAVPRPRTRTRVATRLRRVADRIDH